MTIKQCCHAALWAAFFLSAPVSAEILRAEGVASLEVGRVAARQLAIDDAVRQMAMTYAGSVSAVSQSSNGDLSEAMLTGPRTLPGTPRVQKETEREGLLFVTVTVDTTEAERQAASAATAAAGGESAAAHACARPTAPVGRFLTRRLVSTYFEVKQPQDAGDLGSIATWLPSELTRKLNVQRDVRALDAGQLSLFPGGKVQEAWQAADTVRDIGRREDVQFVLAGRILDTAVTRKEPRVGAFGNSVREEQGMYYTGPMGVWLGLAAKKVPVERRFRMEYWLYDALTGGVLATAVLDRSAHGDVQALSMRSFDMGRFEQNDYGHAVLGLLDELAGKLATTMHCLPFSARVVRVDGDRLYLGAGSLDGLATGDRLIVYKLQPQTEIRRNDGVVLGVPETTAGDVELLQVQPRFAVAMVRNSKGKINAGDWVRFPAPH